MKKCNKEIAKVVVAILAAMLMFFVPIGQIVSVADANEDISISSIEGEFYFEVPSETLNQDINLIVTTTTVATTTIITTTTTTVVTIEKAKETMEKNEVFIFKPETHYVHTKDCYWAKSGEIKEITNTVDIEARLCNECCPDIEIINLYDEPIVEYYEEEIYEEEDYETTEEITYSAQGSYNLSDWDYTLLCRIVSSEYGSDWVPVEEKAKIVASVMAMVYNPNYPDTIEGVLDVSCAPWGFNKYYDYYMSDSIYAAVDYYFTSGAFDGWACTSWCGDGTWNYFY